MITLADILDPAVVMPSWLWSLLAAVVGVLVVGLVVRTMSSIDKRQDMMDTKIAKLETDITDLRVLVASGKNT